MALLRAHKNTLVLWKQEFERDRKEWFCHFNAGCDMKILSSSKMISSICCWGWSMSWWIKKKCLLCCWTLEVRFLQFCKIGKAINSNIWLWNIRIYFIRQFCFVFYYKLSLPSLVEVAVWYSGGGVTPVTTVSGGFSKIDFQIYFLVA